MYKVLPVSHAEILKVGALLQLCETLGLEDNVISCAQEGHEANSSSSQFSWGLQGWGRGLHGTCGYRWNSLELSKETGSIGPNNHAHPEERWGMQCDQGWESTWEPHREVLSNGGCWGEHSQKKKMLWSTHAKTAILAKAHSRRKE